MAQFINRVHGGLMRPIHVIQENLPFDGTGYANKLWRMKILYNRSTSPREQRVVTSSEVDPAKTQINTKVSSENLERQRAYVQRPKNLALSGYEQTISPLNNQIIVINPEPSNSEEGFQQVIIQGMPKEINVSPDTTWATIKTVGRNNPFYHYTGAEDTITLDISWYSTEPNRRDVIRKCRIFESWSKANAYQSAPPELWLSWGSSNLFQNYSFILFHAPYSLTNFASGYRRSREKDAEIIDLGLIPTAATQKLVFKRVTVDNLTTRQIQEYERHDQL